MLQLVRGFRGKLDDILDSGRPFTVTMTTSGNAVYDTCCFGVDSKEKLSDDRYMIFYNQSVAPENAVSMVSRGKDFLYTVDLPKLPADIVKLVFTVSIDGRGTMGEISEHRVSVSQDGAVCAELILKGGDFQREKAIIDIEIYNKTVWRCSAVARGFDGGLAELLKHFGGEIAVRNNPEPPAPRQPAPRNTAPRPSKPQTSAPNYSAPRPVTPVTPTPNYSAQRPIAPVTSTPNYSAPVSAGAGISDERQVADRLMKKISLSKDKVKLEKHVVNLSKCVVDLSKKSGVDLGNTRAKVVVALDYSGSMSGLYRNGVVQDTLNRLVPLGLTFDDNGAIDIFLFQTDFRKMDDLNLSNYENYVNSVIFNSGYYMGGTNYFPVLQCIIDGCYISKGLFRGKQWIPPIVDGGDPTFILFITDGENADKAATDTIIRSCSSKNVFI